MHYTAMQMIAICSGLAWQNSVRQMVAIYTARVQIAPASASPQILYYMVLRKIKI